MKFCGKKQERLLPRSKDETGGKKVVSIILELLNSILTWALGLDKRMPLTKAII
jgi:hypothetical protein